MTPFPFDTTPGWVRALRAGALGGSVVFHLALLWFGFHYTPKPDQKDTWMEMAVVPPKPPPPVPPPPPPPEKPAPKPKPKPVDFKDTVKEPPKEPPPEAAPEKKVVRRIMGLSATSFAQGSGTGIDARAGTTLGTHATNDTMSLDEAKNAVAFSAATVQPKLRYKPEMITPADLKTPGVVAVLLDLDIEGKVIAARLVPGQAALGSGAEETCVTTWKKARFSPGKQGDQAVPITNLPESCRFVVIE